MGQTIAFLHIFGQETIRNIVSIGGLKELGLPSDNPSVYILLNADKLKQFSEVEKQENNEFFEEFNDVFAKTKRTLV